MDDEVSGVELVAVGRTRFGDIVLVCAASVGVTGFEITSTDMVETGLTDVETAVSDVADSGTVGSAIAFENSTNDDPTGDDSVDEGLGEEPIGEDRIDMEKELATKLSDTVADCRIPLTGVKNA